MKLNFNFSILSILAICLCMIGAFAPEIAWATQAAAEAAPAIVEQAKWVGTVSSVLAFGLQLLKNDLFGGLLNKLDKRYQPALVVLLTQIGALVQSVASGKNLLQAAIEWAFVAGGAMAIYTLVIKPFTKKKEEAPKVAA